MSRSVFPFFVALLLLGGTANAGGGLGVGLILEGDKPGISVKKWLGGGASLNLGGSYALSGPKNLHIHADYVLHNFRMLRELTPKSARNRLSVYYGIGARGKLSNLDNQNQNSSFSDELDLGIRFPLGITYLLRSAPVDVFAELVPTLNVYPSSNLNWRTALGIRYYFDSSR